MRLCHTRRSVMPSLFLFALVQIALCAYDPTDPQIDHTTIAIELDEAGDIAGSIEAFRAAANFSPDSPEVWRNLAVALGDSNPQLKAIASYTKKAEELELNDQIGSLCPSSPQPGECEALLRFGASLQYVAWRRNTQFTGVQWGSSSDCCEWEGVQCEQGRVKLLGLINLGLTGDVSAITLLQPLEHLKELVLMMNRLSGQIPELSALSWTPTLEYFGLDQNMITGTLPASIGELTSLKEMVIWGNAITGSFPAIPKLTKLETLSAANCSFSGKLPELHKLPALEAIYLQENDFTGSIPELPQSTALKRVWFSDNQLTGITPDLSAHLDTLDMLHLERNRLSSVHTSTCDWVLGSKGKKCSTNHCHGRECMLNGNGIDWACSDDAEGHKQEECAAMCGSQCSSTQKNVNNKEELR